MKLPPPGSRSLSRRAAARSQPTIADIPHNTSRSPAAKSRSTGIPLCTPLCAGASNAGASNASQPPEAMQPLRTLILRTQPPECSAVYGLATRPSFQLNLLFNLPRTGSG